ncbi:MAG: GNAT family N-acetyltransferase [Frankiaceae bacterium]
MLRRDGRWAPAVVGRTLGGVRLREAAAAELMGLRRAVLRAGRDQPPAGIAEDDDPATVHLAILAEDATVVGALTLVAQPYPDDPDADSVRLALMAVAPAHQRRGVGSTLVEAAQDLVSGRLDLIWVTARDSALGFYARHGFQVTSPGFVGAMGLPHHRMVWQPHPSRPRPDAPASDP